MRYLFRAAIQNRKHLSLLALTFISMCLLALASQLEVFSLGVITRGSSGGKGDGVVEQGVEWLSPYINLTDDVKSLALFVVFVAFFKAISLFLHRFSTRMVAIKISRDLRQSYFDHIQSLPMEFYEKYNIGSLSSRVVADSKMVAEAINSCLLNYLQTPFLVATSLFFCFLSSWKLSLFVFLGLPLILFPIVFIARQIKRISRHIQKNQEVFASVIIDFLSGIQTVKVFAMEEFSRKKYQEQNNKMADLETRIARYDVAARPIVHMIGMGFLASAIIVGLYIFGMSVSEVLFYCGMLFLLYEPIKKFSEENTLIQKGVAAAERMYEVLSIEPKIQDESGAAVFTDFKKGIEFDNVWFRYGEEWVLRGVTFTVEKGKTVAIVGPTGGGKSTIVQLLPRLYDVQKGQIRIDGEPLKSYTQTSLREKIAFVPQKPFLFLDTVAENISFGRPFSREAIELAAKKAQAEEFIQRLPKTYDTMLSEAGRNLSGGQQQRLAIARALVKDAPILVLDEATSALDAISEDRVKKVLEGLRGFLTQIVVAHRLSTIEDADKIIYIERGEIVAEGTKEELLVSCPGFRKMWETVYKTKK